MDVMEQDLVTLRTRADELQRQVEALRNDPYEVEKIAREQGGFVRPGETVYKFPPSSRRPPK
jgi:cell division protein FtsB